MPKDRKEVFRFQLFSDASGFINHFKGNACERTSQASVFAAQVLFLGVIGC